MIQLKKGAIEKWAVLRKMSPEQVINGLRVEGDKLHLTFRELEQLANRLNVLPTTLLEEENKFDLDRGVKVLRNGTGFIRTSERNGKKYYTYHHLVTTNAYPTLMPLRVELHCNDEKNVVLNGGHDSTEIVYVTKGTVRMHWEYENEMHYMDLEVGDSVYIQPGVSHSFMAVGDEKAELIAVNW